MLVCNHFEREDSEFGNSVRRPGSPSYDALIDHTANSNSNSDKNVIKRFAVNGPHSKEIHSSSEINRLSGELNQIITQKMNDLMCSLSSLFQRAISGAVNEQVLAKIQASLKSGSGQMPEKGWNTPTERPEDRSEENLSRKARSSSRDEFPRNLNGDEDEEDTHYTHFGKEAL